MNKHILPASLLVPLLLLAAAPTAGAQEEIRYLDRTTKKEVVASGTIQEETPSRVVYKSSTAVGTKEIPALDIVEIIYEVPGAVKLVYGRARGDERKATDLAGKDEERQKTTADALQSYQEVLSKLTGDRYKRAERHLRFRMARLLASDADEDDAQRDAAIAALQKFTKQYPDGWQITAAARLLARLQLARGDAPGARQTYTDLAATADLPKEVQQECDLHIAEALILGKQFPEAEKKLQALLRTVGNDEVQAARIRIYLLESQGASGQIAEAATQLEALIARTPDKDLKALAYNALGDSYRLNGRAKEALWAYLWVDVIYHQDRQEHVRAMEQLARLFDEQGDKSRAKQYRDRLKKSK